jgi:hypothetical protein
VNRSEEKSSIREFSSLTRRRNRLNPAQKHRAGGLDVDVEFGRFRQF